MSELHQINLTDTDNLEIIATQLFSLTLFCGPAVLATGWLTYLLWRLRFLVPRIFQITVIGARPCHAMPISPPVHSVAYATTCRAVPYMRWPRLGCPSGCYGARATAFAATRVRSTPVRSTRSRRVRGAFFVLPPREHVRDRLLRLQKPDGN